MEPTTELTRSWRDQAACLNMPIDLFYPYGPDTRANIKTTADAKTVCAGCPVRMPCLTEALGRRESYGIYGGLTDRERARVERMIRRRGDTTAAYALADRLADPAEIVARARQADEMARRYRAGESATDIAEALGVSRQHVLNRLRDLGVTVRTTASGRGRRR